MTKANIMHASKKFRNRRPCQKCWVSDGGAVGAAIAGTAMAVSASLGCSVVSASFITATLLAME